MSQLRCGQINHILSKETSCCLYFHVVRRVGDCKESSCHLLDTQVRCKVRVPLVWLISDFSKNRSRSSRK